jgi:predicted nuclease of predicted toxin-antitoxin system
VKLLFDEYPPPSLVPRVAQAFPGSAHVRSLDLERASDAKIWEFAKEGGYTIVTKDGDFHHLSFFHGAPPFVVWLRVGNCSVAAIAKILDERLEDISRFIADAGSAVLVIDRSPDRGASSFHAVLHP